MNYINKGKRDILILPKFENLDELEIIRKEYDELYGILPPHITLAFPFENEMSNDELKSRLLEITSDIQPIQIELEGVSLHEDKRVNTNYIFLDFKKGQDKIIELHNKIYKNVLQTKLNFEYIPHITLGCTNNKELQLDLKSNFQTIISKISVELIGEKEESEILFEIELQSK